MRRGGGRAEDDHHRLHHLGARPTPARARATAARALRARAARALAAQRGGDEERVDPSVAEIWIHFGCAEALRAAARVKALDAEVAHLVRQITRDVDALGLQKLAASADGAERGLLGGGGGDRAIGAPALRAQSRALTHARPPIVRMRLLNARAAALAARDAAPQSRARHAPALRGPRRAAVCQSVVDAQAERVAQLRRNDACAAVRDAPDALRACFITFHDARAARSCDAPPAAREPHAPARAGATARGGRAAGRRRRRRLRRRHGRRRRRSTQVLPRVSRAPEPAEVRWENLELSDLRRVALAARTAVVVLTVLSAAGLACFFLLKEQRDIIEAGGDQRRLSVTQQLAANVQSGVYAAVIAAVGIVERKLLIGLVELEGHASIEREQRDLVVKTTLVLSINAGVLLTLANVDEHGAEFGATWYASVGNAIVLSLLRQRTRDARVELGRRTARGGSVRTGKPRPAVHSRTPTRLPRGSAQASTCPSGSRSLR